MAARMTEGQLRALMTIIDLGIKAAGIQIFAQGVSEDLRAALDFLQDAVGRDPEAGPE